MIQGGENPVAEQDENDDSAQRDEVRIATLAIILLLILGRARIYAITLKWGAAISLSAMARHQLADRSKLPSSVTITSIGMSWRSGYIVATAAWL